MTPEQFNEAIEIRAAEIGQNPKVWRKWLDCRIEAPWDTGTLTIGALSNDRPPGNWNGWSLDDEVNYWAGWLAYQIGEHDLLQSQAKIDGAG